MNNWRQQIKDKSYPILENSNLSVLIENDTETLIKENVLNVIERIEDAKLNKLWEVIEKLKQEYK